jgi:LacI family transcriptional regulator
MAGGEICPAVVEFCLAGKVWLSNVDDPDNSQMPTANQKRTRIPMNGKITQKWIAKSLEISPSIVSLVVNDPETNRASEETKERIFELMRKSSGVVKNPRVGDTLLLINDPLDSKYHFQNELVCGAQSMAIEANLKVQIAAPSQDLRPYVLGVPLRGMLLISHENLSEAVRGMANLVPMVTVNPTEHADFLGNAVVPDYHAGMIRAIGHLRAHGHVRIGYIGYRPPPAPCSSSRERERLGEFRDACETQGVAALEEDIHIFEAGENKERQEHWTCAEVVSRWVEQIERPSAFVLYNDHLAVRFYQAAIAAGVSIPSDLSVVSFDNEPVCEQLTPGLTSVAPDFFNVGRLAVSVLLTRSAGIPVDQPGFKIVSPVRLIERGSVACSG